MLQYDSLEKFNKKFDLDYEIKFLAEFNINFIVVLSYKYSD